MESEKDSFLKSTNVMIKKTSTALLLVDGFEMKGGVERDGVLFCDQR